MMNGVTFSDLRSDSLQAAGNGVRFGDQAGWRGAVASMCGRQIEVLLCHALGEMRPQGLAWRL